MLIVSDQIDLPLLVQFIGSHGLDAEWTLVKA